MAHCCNVVSLFFFSCNFPIFEMILSFFSLFNAFICGQAFIGWAYKRNRTMMMTWWRRRRRWTYFGIVWYLIWYGIVTYDFTATVNQSQRISDVFCFSFGHIVHILCGIPWKSIEFHGFSKTSNCSILHLSWPFWLISVWHETPFCTFTMNLFTQL